MRRLKTAGSYYTGGNTDKLFGDVKDTLEQQRCDLAVTLRSLRTLVGAETLLVGERSLREVEEQVVAARAALNTALILLRDINGV